MITTVLALLFCWWIDRKSPDFTIMGLYAKGVLPLGAFMLGVFAGSGYCGASWWRGVKIGGRLLLFVLAMQAAAYAATLLIEYDEAAPKLGNGKRMSFVEYLDRSTRAFQFQKFGENPRRLNRAGGGLGVAGYVFRGLELIGFVGGGLLAPALLLGVPYCQRCRMYMRKRCLALLPAGLPVKELKKLSDAERQECVHPLLDAAYSTMRELAARAQACDAAGFADLCHEHGSTARAVNKLSAHVQVMLIYCPHCRGGTLEGASVANSGKETAKTEILSHPVQGEFVEKLLRLL
jgi:hypothetical protein